MPRYNNPRKTWFYPLKLKIQAVKLSNNPDYTVGEAAERLGLHPCMLSRWRKEYRTGILQGDGKLRFSMRKKNKTTPRKLTELAALKKKVARLELENDFLKKWQQYQAELHPNASDSSNNTNTPSE